MAENLAHQKGNNWCYDNVSLNCVKYGRLYDWNTAKSICLSGWHLPSNDEWNDLIVNAAGSKDSLDFAGMKLKSKTGWDNNNGTDNYGFSILPGGGYYENLNVKFQGAGIYGSFWTATYHHGTGIFEFAYYRSIGEGYQVNENDGITFIGFYVRCVQN